jgi:hypothetical protein
VVQTHRKRASGSCSRSLLASSKFTREREWSAQAARPNLSPDDGDQNSRGKTSVGSEPVTHTKPIVIRPPKDGLGHLMNRGRKQRPSGLRAVVTGQSSGFLEKIADRADG